MFFWVVFSYAKLINNEKIFFLYLTKNIGLYAFDLFLTSFGLFVLASRYWLLCLILPTIKNLKNVQL